MSTDKTERRAQTLAGLRELLDFLEANPDLPTPTCVSLSPNVFGTDEEKRGEVDRIARILDRAPQDRADGDHYHVSRAFGPVRYEATAITDDHMARYDALMSYNDAVLPAGSAQ